jgi:acyl transferase domain-containing protein
MAVPSLGDSPEEKGEWTSMLYAVGQVWLNGISLDWDAFFAQEDRQRVPLPTYPFERQRHWVDPLPARAIEAVAPGTAPASTPAAPIAQPIVIATNTLSRKERIANRLVEIIAPISGRDSSAIDRTATFLEQGFDSLSLVQVASAIRAELGVKVGFGMMMRQVPNIDLLAGHLEKVLPAESFAEAAPSPAPAAVVTVAGTTSPSSSDLRDIVEEQGRTIARLARLIEGASAQTQQTAKPLATNPPASVFELPSTIPQRGIFLSSRLSDHLSAAYNESVTLQIAGKIGVAALERTVQALCKRHDALRASFDAAGTVIRFHAESHPTFEVIDLSGIDAPQQDERLGQLIAKDGEQSFPLPDGPLFRAKVAIFSSARAAIVFTGHHVICDGWSLDVLIHNFCVFYSAEVGGVTASLPPVQPYREYIQQCARTSSAEFQAARQHYEKQFADGFPVLVLPTDRPRTGQRSFACQRREIVLAPATVRALRTCAASEGSSFFGAVLAAYALLLARVSGQRRFVIALPTAEQAVLDQPQLVGHCVNMLPFEIDIVPDMSMAAFLTGVQQQLSHAHDHAAYTITHILDRLRPARHMVGVRPVSVGLTSMKKWRLSDLPQHGFALDFDANAKRFESFEFYLMALERGDELVLRCNFDTELFAATTIETWMKNLAVILEAMPNQLATPLGNVVPAVPTLATPAPDVSYLLAGEAPTSHSSPTQPPPAPGTTLNNGQSLEQQSLTSLPLRLTITSSI